MDIRNRNQGTKNEEYENYKTAEDTVRADLITLSAVVNDVLLFSETVVFCCACHRLVTSGHDPNQDRESSHYGDGILSELITIILFHNSFRGPLVSFCPWLSVDQECRTES